MMRALLVLLSFAVVVNGQIPHTFDSGAVAKASEVNENFTYLMGRIDSLKNENTNLKAQIDTLKNIALLPIGTVLATMVQMDTLNGIWVLADGESATMEYFEATGENKVPDLRGMFLRGLNEERNDGKEDPDPDFEGNIRVVGSYQADTLKSHSHLENLAAGNGGIHSGGSFGVINQVQTGKTGGAETRPRNIAVYWYVKVK